MAPYKTKSSKIEATSLREVNKVVRATYKQITSKTKRQPYVRSAYFKKEKVFFTYFWDHLKQQYPKKKFCRLQYFKAAIELAKNSKEKPIIDPRSNNSETLYRFTGITADNELFFVQIKENKKTGKKYFMSCFSEK